MCLAPYRLHDQNPRFSVLNTDIVQKTVISEWVRCKNLSVHFIWFYFYFTEFATPGEVHSHLLKHYASINWESLVLYFYFSVSASLQLYSNCNKLQWISKKPKAIFLFVVTSVAKQLCRIL